MNMSTNRIQQIIASRLSLTAASPAAVSKKILAEPDLQRLVSALNDFGRVKGYDHEESMRVEGLLELRVDIIPYLTVSGDLAKATGDFVLFHENFFRQCAVLHRELEAVPYQTGVYFDVQGSIPKMGVFLLKNE